MNDLLILDFVHNARLFNSDYKEIFIVSMKYQRGKDKNDNVFKIILVG